MLLKALALDRDLPARVLLAARNFDTRDHHTYSVEEPQALTADQMRTFLELLRELYPQHHAMVLLGFCTGLRPSSLRPLRRSGSTPDIRWDEHRLLVRRSQTRGQRLLETSKQRTRYSIALPTGVTEILQWHVDTQRGMRRTFNDLARAANVESLVTRSISGHLTERMQHHYSTISAVEQERGLAQVIRLITPSKGVPQRSDVPETVPSGVSGGVSSSEAVSGTKKPAAATAATG